MTFLSLPLVVPLVVGAGAPPRRGSTAHPDVQAAQRLFTAWIEGRSSSAGFPGLAVGVVADQELVWAKGFGLADTTAKTPMTPQTQASAWRRTASCSPRRR